MRLVKLYGGIALILIAVLVLALTFYRIIPLDKEVYNVVLLVCGGMVIAGVVLSFVGGKLADKIGGK